MAKGMGLLVHDRCPHFLTGTERWTTDSPSPLSPNASRARHPGHYHITPPFLLGFMSHTTKKVWLQTVIESYLSILVRGRQTAFIAINLFWPLVLQCSGYVLLFKIIITRTGFSACCSNLGDMVLVCPEHPHRHPASTTGNRSPPARAPGPTHTCTEIWWN